MSQDRALAERRAEIPQPELGVEVERLYTLALQNLNQNHQFLQEVARRRFFGNEDREEGITFPDRGASYTAQNKVDDKGIQTLTITRTSRGETEHVLAVTLVLDNSYGFSVKFEERVQVIGKPNIALRRPESNSAEAIGRAEEFIKAIPHWPIF